MGGIPPPPPMIGGIPPPPPMMFGGMPTSPMNSNISPNRTPGIRLKSLNWTKLDNRKINGTIWKEINEEEEQVEILDNDWKSKVEEIFSEKNRVKVNKEVVTNNDPSTLFNNQYIYINTILILYFIF